MSEWIIDNVGSFFAFTAGDKVIAKNNNEVKFDNFILLTLILYLKYGYTSGI